MSFSKITSKHDWIGLSSEIKPTTGRDGSTFYETDTWSKYIWHDSAWTQLPTISISSALSTINMAAAGTTIAYTTGYLELAGDVGGNTIKNITGGSTGDRLVIHHLDSNITIQASAGIRMQGGIASPNNDWGPGAAYDRIEFQKSSGGTWIENKRSLNSLVATTTRVQTARVPQADITIRDEDATLFFDGTTPGDTDYWIGIVADEVGDDNDTLKIGKGLVKGTTPFLTFDKDGGFTSQNLANSTTAVQINAAGGTTVFNIDTTNKKVGIGTATLNSRFQVDGVSGIAGTPNSLMLLRDTVSNIGFLMGATTNYGWIAAFDILVTADNIDLILQPTGTNSNVGVGIVSPGRKLDVIDASNPQLRLTHTGGTVYGEMQADANGDLSVVTTGSQLIYGAGTKHDGYTIRKAAEVQTGDATVTTIDTVALLDENTYHIEALIVGVQSDGLNRASYHLAGTFYRTGAAAASTQGTVTSFHTQESNAAWAATLTPSGNNVLARVTGAAGATIEWGASLSYINMSS